MLHIKDLPDYREILYETEAEDAEVRLSFCFYPKSGTELRPRYPFNG